jgi:hypothetical protein
MYEYGLYVLYFDYSSDTGNNQQHVYCLPVSNKLMMKNLVVSELLSIFAVLFRAALLRASHFRAGM